MATVPASVSSRACETQDRDDAMSVIEFITAEMNTNANGPDSRRIKELNLFNYKDCIAEYQALPLWRQLFSMGVTPQQCVEIKLTSREAALVSWAIKVRQNGPWDHKPTIRQRFNPLNPGGIQTYHRIGDHEYFYDIWSNIHFGYVGKACAFSDSDLLDGAGLEQAGSDLLRRRLPQRYSKVSGMRAYDDQSDQEAIQIGISLFQKTPTGVTPGQVRVAVESGTHLTRRLIVGGVRKAT